MTSLASLVFFSRQPGELARLLTALEVPLEHELHDDEIEHWAAELGDVHVAVYGGETPGAAPELRSGGSTFPGLYVDDLDVAAKAAEEAGAVLIVEHQQRPWGCRAIVRASDGHVIEVNQKDHCDG